MTIRITHLLTVIAAVFLLFIGHRIATKGLFVFQDAPQEVIRAKVMNIVERVKSVEGEDSEEFLPGQGDIILFEAKVTSGALKGETITAVQQSYSAYSKTTQREAGKGDSVLLIRFGNLWLFNGYLRINKLLGLGIFFTLCVFLSSRRKRKRIT